MAKRNGKRAKTASSGHADPRSSSDSLRHEGAADPLDSGLGILARLILRTLLTPPTTAVARSDTSDDDQPTPPTTRSTAHNDNGHTGLRKGFKDATQTAPDKDMRPMRTSMAPPH
jgi:hypothetical protein